MCYNILFAFKNKTEKKITSLRFKSAISPHNFLTLCSLFRLRFSFTTYFFLSAFVQFLHFFHYHSIYFTFFIKCIKRRKIVNLNELLWITKFRFQKVAICDVLACCLIVIKREVFHYNVYSQVTIVSTSTNTTGNYSLFFFFFFQFLFVYFFYTFYDYLAVALLKKRRVKFSV